MAFFLLGRSEHGGLSLLSDAAFESRQEALAELGQITADPAFDRWSDEVVLVDLDAGTPVLLVRPAEAAAEPDVDSEAEEDPESAVFAAIADEEPDEDAGDSEPETVEAVELDDAPSEPDDAPAEELATEELETLEAEPEAAQLTEETAEVAADAEGMDSLRDAIARTTQHMEATGIVAPESIGPSDDAGVDNDTAKEAAASDQGSDEPAAVPAPEPPTWPWATAAEAGAASEDVGGDADVTETPFVLEGLEDPAIDAGGSLITASIDDDELAANRPVILGAYGEEPEQVPPAGSEVEQAAQAGEGIDADVTDAPDALGEAVVEAETAHDPAEESDFIVLDQDSDEPETPATADDESAPAAGLDLDSIKSAGSTPEPVPAGADSDGGVRALSSYVCDDCVYVDTCPNKDQRRPEDCGSFQWK